MLRKKNKAFLVGPFIGELSWEFYRFAPYIINLKKKNPTKKIIVFTRPSRFDLYGVYADILVPLKLISDDSGNHNCFTIKDFNGTGYSLLSKAFITKYQKRFKVIDHIHPDISRFYYKVKWQFPRDLMDYDFKPRIVNTKYVEKYNSGNLIFYNVYNRTHPQCLRKYDVEFANTFYEELSFNYDNQNITSVGCLIELIKKCKFVISSFDSFVSHLALLLKIPVIAPRENISEDKIHLLNPLNTPVILYDELERGIECYENNF